jgi:hypothetical protein
VHLAQIVRAVGIPDAREACAGNDLASRCPNGEQSSTAALSEVNTFDLDEEPVTAQRNFISLGSALIKTGRVTSGQQAQDCE